MKNLQIDDGYITMSINEDPSRTISFNPTDPHTVDRFLCMMDHLHRRAVELEKEAPAVQKKMDEAADDFERARIRNEFDMKYDTFVRKEINEVFGDGADKAIFRNVSPIAVTRNGVTVFEGFIQAVLPIFRKEIERRQSETKSIIAQFKPKG